MFQLYTLLLIISSLSTVATSAPHQNDTVLSFYEERDLELFTSINKTHQGVIDKLNLTKTSYGRKELELFLRFPLIEHTEINQRQALLKKILTDETLFNKLEAALTEFKDNEHTINNFWDTRKNELNQKILQKFYFKYSFLQNGNKNPIALDIGHFLEFASLFGTTLEHLFLHFGIDAIQNLLTSHNHHDHDETHSKHHTHDHNCGCSAHLTHADDASQLVKLFFTGLKATHFTLHLFNIKDMIEHLMYKGEIVNVLHQEMIGVSSCIRAMCIIKDEFKLLNQTLLEPINPTALTNLFNIQEDGNAVHPIIKTLLSLDFKNEPKNQLSFYSSVGTTLVACAEFNEQKELLTPALKTLGQLDALMAIATWIKKNNSPSTPICFVSLSDNNAPTIELDATWNLMLDKNSLITTDLAFGNTTPLATSKMVLTGPNKSGKSSMLKTLALNTILAQSFGIATAKRMLLTPFKKIITYIAINDDISNDQSMAVAEILRADNCIQTLNTYKDKGFVLTLIDDALFKSTSFTRGQETAYRFIKNIAEYPNTIALVISHFPMLTQLEQATHGTFCNRQTNIMLDTTGKKTSTFSLKPGSCPQEAIFDLLEEQGYNTSFVANY